MNKGLFILGMLSMVLIAGCSKIVPVATTTSSVQTTIDSTTTIEEVMEVNETKVFDCPEKYQRNNVNGTIYCPDPKIFGVDSYAELENQVLDDEIFTTTSSSPSSSTSSESTSSSITTSTTSTSTTSSVTTTSVEDYTSTTIVDDSGSNIDEKQRRMI